MKDKSAKIKVGALGMLLHNYIKLLNKSANLKQNATTVLR